MRRDFYALYLQARFLNKEEREVANAFTVFIEEGFPSLRLHLSEAALETPVLLTDKLSNRVLAVHLTSMDGKRIIAVNTRFKVDPDVLAHTLVEEFVHTQQVLDKVDFESQKTRFSYDARPYEQEAKRIATEILGYDPDDYAVYLLRPEPQGALYDRISPNPSQ